MAMHHVISHTQEAVENRLSYFWAFLDIEGASDSNSCDTQMLPNQTGLEIHCSNGLALCWVAQKLVKLTGKKRWRDLWPRAIHRGAFY
jgi:hypothetical protein